MVFTTPEQRLFSKIQLPAQKWAHRERAEFHLLCSALLCSALLFKHVRKSAHCQAPFHSRFPFALAVPTQKTDLRSTGPMGRRLAAGWLKPLQAGPCSFASPPYDGSANDFYTQSIPVFAPLCKSRPPHPAPNFMQDFWLWCKKQSLLRFRMQLFVYELESAVR